MKRGEIFILAAPSGAGATVLVDHVLARAPAGSGRPRRPVEYTSRPRREAEAEGREYHFVDRRGFREMIERDRFLEWSEVAGDLYGTSREEVESALERGIDVLLECDVDRAERLRAACPEARSIVVLPPGFGAPPERPGGESPGAARPGPEASAVSSSELRLYDRFDCVIINDDLKRASDVLAAIILAKGHREKNHRATRVEEGG